MNPLTSVFASGKSRRGVFSIVLGLSFISSWMAYPASANDDLIRFGIGIGTQLLKNEIERRQRQAPPAQQDRRDQSQVGSRKAAPSQRNNVVFQLQSKLKDLGFDPGPIDGDWGRKTQNALIAWQQSIGEDGTGVLTDAQRVRLGLQPKSTASATNVPAATESPPSTLAHIDGEAPISDSPISGVWQGQLSCSSGRDLHDVMVEISGPTDRRFKMIINTFRFFGSGSSEASLSYVGEYESDNERYFFVLVEHQAGFGHMKPDQALVTIDSNGNPLINLTNEKCSPLNLTKADPRRAPQYALTTPVIPNGTFFSSDDPRERCQAIIDWAARWKKEREQFPKDRQKSIIPLLFDDWFIPVFGRPYDIISPQELHRTYHSDFRELCKRDPIIKARTEYAANIMNDAFAHLSGGLVSKYYFAVHQVRKNRILHHVLQDISADVELAVDSHEAFAHIGKLLATLEREPGSLWPSELAEEKSKAEAWRIEIAKAVVEHDLVQIELLADPSEVLRMTSGYPTRVREAHSFLPEGEKRRLGDRYAVREKWAVRELSEPALLKARALRPSLESVRRVRGMSNQVSKLLKSANTSLQTDVRNAFGQVELDLISPVVAQDVQILFAYPAGKLGIRQIRSWRDAFESRYKEFDNMAPVLSARNTFVEVRAKQMVDAIVDFEADVEQLLAKPSTGEKQFEALLDEYLFDPEMRRAPISLEYLFVLEAAKAKSQI